MKISSVAFYGMTIVVPLCLLGWAMLALWEMIQPVLTALGTR